MPRSTKREAAGSGRKCRAFKEKNSGRCVEDEAGRAVVDASDDGPRAVYPPLRGILQRYEGDGVDTCLIRVLPSGVVVLFVMASCIGGMCLSWGAFRCERQDTNQGVRLLSRGRLPNYYI